MTPRVAAAPCSYGVFEITVGRPGLPDGPALVEVMTLRHEIVIPPGVTFEQARGFTLWGTRSIFGGAGGDVIEVLKTNIRQVETEFV